MSPEFKPWAKTPRLASPFVVTEKIDGTNSAIVIEEEVLTTVRDTPTIDSLSLAHFESSDGLAQYHVYAQSRSRFIYPGSDNYGFAAWVKENAEALVASLGPGYHYGEWWGNGIQRGYGLSRGDKRFSLFNVKRWNPYDTWNGLWAAQQNGVPLFEVPAMSLVPILCWGDEDTHLSELAFSTDAALGCLKGYGSFAAKGYMNPEGIVVYHTRSGQTFKAYVEGETK